MADIIEYPDLASYPGIVLGSSEDATALLTLVNGLIGEITVNGVSIADLDPMPTRAKVIALEVAARALRMAENGGATSVSKKIDDWSKTVRWEGPSSEQTGIFLTGDELARLQALLTGGARVVGSFPMNVPGFGTGYGSQRL